MNAQEIRSTLRKPHNNTWRTFKLLRLDDMTSFHPSPYTFLAPLILLLFLPLSSCLPSTLRWTSSQDPCYQPDQTARHCRSEFINAAYGVPVCVSAPPSVSRKNITSLTDLHNPHNLTCWQGDETGRNWTLTVPLGRRFEVTYVSLQFCHQGEPHATPSMSILKSMDHGHSWTPLQYYSHDCKTVFGLPTSTSAPSRHQETEPLCSDPFPLQKHRGGLVLAFSTLDGRPSAADFDNSHVLQDWVTATDIRVVFHKQQDTTEQQGAGLSKKEGWALRWRTGPRDSRKEAGWVMSDVQLRDKELSSERDTSTKMLKTKKSVKKSRRTNQKTPRLSKGGHHMSEKEGRKQRTGEHQRKKCKHGGCDWTVLGHGTNSKGQELRRKRNNNKNHTPVRGGTSHYGITPPFSQSAMPTPHSPALLLSDLQVGGRCKCNGHASQCRRDGQGRAVCQCQHHTSGTDCDSCESFYCDRPWQRGTPTEPHPCVPCECHSHSSRCRFSMQVFLQSGRHSGGVCLQCRHNTAGRQCQYCRSGFTRDHSKALDHRRACQPCQCHPVGALGRWCNQTSGQCLCRLGVTGLRCNRCAPGYQQGRSSIWPCVKIQPLVPTTPVYQPQYSIGEECRSYCQPSQTKVRMNLETYCAKDYVLRVQVRGMERSGPWWQFSVSVQSVFRLGTSQVRRGPQSLWVPDRDLGCGCPTLQVGRTFLLIGAKADGQSWGPEESRLVADRSTVALQWREHWSHKLRGFRGQDKRGQCLTPSGHPNATAPMPKGDDVRV